MRPRCEHGVHLPVLFPSECPLVFPLFLFSSPLRTWPGHGDQQVAWGRVEPRREKGGQVAGSALPREWEQGETATVNQCSPLRRAKSSSPGHSCIWEDRKTGSHGRNVSYRILAKVVKRVAFSISSLSACRMQRTPRP